MDEAERRQLAQRLSAMSFKDARKAIKRLDRDASLKYYRNSIWDEFHTLFLLPNLGVSVTLVERRDKDRTNEVDAASARENRKKEKVTYSYVEARVAPLTRPVKNVSGRL